MIKSKLLIVPLFLFNLSTMHPEEPEVLIVNSMTNLAFKISQTLVISEGTFEGNVLKEGLESLVAFASVCDSPIDKAITQYSPPLIEMVKSPSSYSHENRVKIILTFVEEISKTANENSLLEAFIVQSNPEAIEHAAEIIVNHPHSIQARQILSFLLILRMSLYITSKIDATSDEIIFTHLEVLKKPWEHSIQEVTNSILFLENTARTMSQTPPLSTINENELAIRMTTYQAIWGIL